MKGDRKVKTAVVGVGNVLLKDEGIGVHVVRALREAVGSRADVDIIDGGTSPDALIGLESVLRLILVDAVRGGGRPGAIYRFHPGDIQTERQCVTSIHQMGLGESLQMMKLSGTQPDDIVIIGVEPKEIDWGLELSPELSERLPQIIKVVMDNLVLD